jgi:cleavage and polyadenylation specificity factor subunit 1
MPEKPIKAHVVLMIDYFTKAAEFAVVYDKLAASVARTFYYSWICRYFVPSHVTSDNGSEFGTEFEHLLARLGIKHVHTTACHPAANGVVERLVQSFKSMLVKHVNEHPLHWLQSLPVMRQQYWARLHSVLGMSPQKMVYGRRPVPVGRWRAILCLPLLTLT